MIKRKKSKRLGTKGFPRRFNVVAADLHTPKYRKRIIESKKRAYKRNKKIIIE